MVENHTNVGIDLTEDSDNSVYRLDANEDDATVEYVTPREEQLPGEMRLEQFPDEVQLQIEFITGEIGDYIEYFSETQLEAVARYRLTDEHSDRDERKETVADQMGISTTTVQHGLDRFKMAQIDTPRQAIQRFNTIQGTVSPKIIRMLLEDPDMSAAQAGRDLGRSESAGSQALYRYRILIEKIREFGLVQDGEFINDVRRLDDEGNVIVEDEKEDEETEAATTTQPTEGGSAVETQLTDETATDTTWTEIQKKADRFDEIGQFVEWRVDELERAADRREYTDSVETRRAIYEALSERFEIET